MVTQQNTVRVMDNMFIHANSTSLCIKPTKFTWTLGVDEELTVFTDNHVFVADRVHCKNKVAWLIESPHVTPSSYDFVKKNNDKFTKIFTFDKSILENVQNSEFMPIGGCWIDKKDHKLYPKTKNTSIIASKKNYLFGHKLRHTIINSVVGLDVYGNGYNPIESKLEGLKDYRFSVVVENCKSDYYFTEKIIDCFVTGTIPIYWGCPSIEKFFDKEGIISFDTIDELNIILNSLEGEYEKRMKSVNTNFNLASEYLVADDTLFKKLNQPI